MPPEPALVSLVFTLSETPALREQALATLRARHDLTCGELSGRWLPAAGEMPVDLPALTRIPGVDRVETVLFRQDPNGAIQPIVPPN